MGTSAEDAFNLASKGRVLKPRFRVMVGNIGDDLAAASTTTPDIGIATPVSANIERRQTLGLDRFKVVCALSKEQDYAFWADFQGMVVEVFLWYEPDPEKMMFHGVADTMDFDVFRGEVTISGRNTGALLVNSGLHRTQLNKPTEDEVKELIEPFGFTADFGIAGPEGDFGFVVKDDKHHIATNFQSTSITVWDKLARMAIEKDCTLYEFDGVIYFFKNSDRDTWTVAAPTRNYDASGRVCKLGPSNASSLRFSHDLLLSKYTQLVIHHTNFHKPETKIYKYPEDVSEFAGKNPTFVEMANRSDEDAAAAAESLQRSVGTAEWRVEWTSNGPEMLDINVVDVVEVYGTNSAIDGPFSIFSIEHNIHWERGLSTTVIAKWGKSSDVGGGSGTE